MQRSAKPRSAVRFRPRPPLSALLAALFLTFATLFHASYGAQTGAATFGNALIDAADSGSVTRISSYLSQGYGVDTPGEWGTTPLMRAVLRGHVDAAQLLLKAGANPNLKDAGGASALHLAVRQGNTDLVKLLLSGGADVNIRDGEGWTPLMRAANARRPDSLRVLLDGGARVNETNAWHETALIYALRQRDATAVDLLLRNDASRSVKDSDGVPAATLAARSGDPAIARQFNQAQAALAQAPLAATREIYSIYVAAFSSSLPENDARAAAAARWTALQKTFPDTLSGHALTISRVPLLDSSGVVYRIRAGGFASEGSARAACAVLRDHGQDCFTVTDSQLLAARQGSAEQTFLGATSASPRAEPANQAPRHWWKFVKRSPPPGDAAPAAMPAPVAIERQPLPEVRSAPLIAPAITPRPQPTLVAGPLAVESPNVSALMVHKPAMKPQPKSLRPGGKPLAVQPFHPPAHASKPVARAVVQRRATGRKPALSTARPQKPKSVAVTRADVDVEEAIPVTKRRTSAPAEPKTQAKPGVPPQTQPVAPSASVDVEIGYFQSETIAGVYGDALRVAMNDGITIKTLHNLAHGESGYRLHLGPLHDTAQAESLCKRVRADAYRCAVTPAAGMDANATPETPSAPEWWLMLGTYPSETDAQAAWNALSRHLPTLLKTDGYQVVQPAHAQLRARVFRLQTGPYGSETAATTACAALLVKGVGCSAVAPN